MIFESAAPGQNLCTTQFWPENREVLRKLVEICIRMVAGFHLSFDAPSSASVGLCLLHAGYDKTPWRRSLRRPSKSSPTVDPRRVA
jgi:hypothetical protein